MAYHNYGAKSSFGLRILRPNPITTKKTVTRPKAVVTVNQFSGLRIPAPRSDPAPGVC